MKYLLGLILTTTLLAETYTDELQYYQSLWDYNIDVDGNWTRPTSNTQFKKYSKKCTDYGSYDFIIIGGGSAGSVLANRLSENSSTSVLLLEAGGTESDFSRIPAAFIPTLTSEMNWGYLTTPQKYSCYSSNNNQCDYSRGKLLGGSSSVNVMLHVRGNKKDFDRWQEIGNPGWAYKNVLPYFMKSENATGISGDEGYRGYNGPLKINYPEPKPTFTDTVINGNKQLGLKNVDYNGRTQIGVARMQTNTAFGRRYSTHTAYLTPIRNRTNLRILTNALAAKINITNNKAVSVKFLSDSKCHVAYANKEIISSAGAVNSPQLLMLSGIGPSSELKKFKIKEVANLPVGKNLYDHPTVFSIPIQNNYSSPTLNFSHILSEYVYNGEGPLTYMDGVQLSFHKLTDQGDQDVPEVEVLYFYNTGAYNRTVFVKKHNNYKDSMDNVLSSMKTGMIVQHFILLHPKSRGTIKLKSTDPTDFPNINPNYLKEKEDIEVLYLAIVRNMKLMDTDAFRAINASFSYIPIKDCENKKDRKYWYCVIRHLTAGIYHPMGTCRMGNNTNTSVVDHNLKVHGIDKLRVIDASVIPLPTSGHLNSVTVMIAEKMSVLIKEEHGIN